jgi:CubicO group peptidase (beta-lactamase class C family)
VEASRRFSKHGTDYDRNQKELVMTGFSVLKLKAMAKATVVAILAIISLGCATQNAAHEGGGIGSGLAELLDGAMLSWMQKAHVEGAALTVVDEKSAIYAQGFGNAVKSAGRKVTPDTVFHVASVSKVFTAAAVMRLVESGAVRLDDPVSRYLPEFHPLSRFVGSREITVRDLLCHHSGLPSEYLRGYMFGPYPPEDFMRRFLELPSLLSDIYVVAPPGSYYLYSDVGCDVLGALVSRIGGEPFEDFMRREILQPLGMSRSGYTIDDGLASDVSRGYHDGKEVPISYYSGLPSTGLLTSAGDLGRFLSMLLAGGMYDGRRVFNESTMREMFMTQNADVPLDMGLEIGLGFDVLHEEDLGGLRVVCKDGWDTPFRSYILMAPEYSLGVAVAANSQEGDPGALAMEVLRTVLRVRNGVEPSTPSPPLKNSTDIGSFVGRYACEIGLGEVKRGPFGYVIEIPWGRFALIPRGEDRFVLQVKLLDLIPLTPPGIGRIALRFTLIDGERVIGLILNGEPIGIASEFETHAVSPAWRSRAGKYRIVDQDQTPYLESFSIEYDRSRDLLFAVIMLWESDPLKLPLDPISEDQIVIAGKGRFLGETMRVVHEDGAEYLMYSGFKLQKMDGSP